MADDVELVVASQEKDLDDGGRKAASAEAAVAWEAYCRKQAEFAELRQWVQQFLRPRFFEWMGRPDIRRLIRIEVELLKAGSTSPLRNSVDAIDKKLVDSAKELLAFLHRPQVRKILGPHGKKAPIALHDRRKEDSLEMLSDRPWRDLVNPQDFFGPVNGLNLKHPEDWRKPGEKAVQMGDFLAFCNSDLRHPGHYLFRTLRIRIDHWLRLLVQARKEICKQLSENGDKGKSLAKKVPGDFVQELIAMDKSLQLGYELHPDVPSSNAATLLFQIVAFVNPTLPPEWLPEPTLNFSDVGLLLDVMRKESSLILENAKRALLKISELCEAEIDPEDRIQDASRKYRLLVVDREGLPRLFWEGEEILGEWTRFKKPWQFWVRLTEKARKSLAITRDDSETCSLASNKSRICSMLPKSLASKVKIVDMGCYRLDLDAKQIQLIRT